MMRSNFLIGIAVSVLTFSVWAYLNRPGQEPEWPERIQGFSFSPIRTSIELLKQRMPTEAELNEDLALLSGKTHAIRTYGMEGILASIPRLAAPHKINVAVGAWIDSDLDKNRREIETLLDITRTNRNIVRVIIGNEVILRDDIPIEKLIEYLDYAQRRLKIPVSTAEPWHVWVKHPELAEHVDFLSVHMLPYWEGVHLDRSVDYIVDHMNKLKEMFPDKPIVITEVGWPSNGRTHLSSVPSEANQAIFLRRFLTRAEEEKYTYYVMEAFDQPWKQRTEGSVGAYWGVYNNERRSKFPFTEPIVPIPKWYLLATISVIIAAATLAVLLMDSRTLRRRGRSFLAIIAFSAATIAVWIVYDYIHQYMTIMTVAVGILMFAGMIGVILILLSEAHEWAEAIWIRERRRAFKPVHIPDDELPMVSIHLPAYNEPPDMMIQTINALNQLDYPKFEIIVVDNNTKSPQIWEPVAAHCAKLGPRVRFFHISPLSGFKAGALNFALKHTAEDAEIIAVIDSDYLVAPSWLKDLVPQFKKPEISLVQAPQDYRDEEQNAFKAMCFAEYRAFFYIGMIVRNERNAIIQHGTMTMVRKTELESVGGWGEWCITEDAELGLRIFEKGTEAVYIPRSYGKGLMPDTFIDYKKQRFRWAYGAIQILRRHARELLGIRSSRLKLGQRYHFVAGWLPWIADGVNLLFALAALIWSFGMILFPHHVPPPLAELSMLPLSLFGFKAIKMIYLYRIRIRTSFTQTMAAGIAGLALSHTIAKAVLLGFMTKHIPFFRTPKLVGKPALFQALFSAGEEWLMLIVLLGAATGCYLRSPVSTLDLHLWLILLMMQSIAYFAAVLLSFISGFPGIPSKIIGTLPSSPLDQN